MDEECYHMGHVILDCFRKRPNAICEIDAATGASQTNARMLSRSIRLARSLRRAGLVPGDVLLLSGRNHLDLHVPYYAALLNGLPKTGVDPCLKYEDIKPLLALVLPKVVFCEPEAYEDYARASADLDLDTKIVTFGAGEHSMESFVQEYDTGENEDDFNPAVFDSKEVFMFLMSTSGTSGAPKVAAITFDAYLQKTFSYTNQIKPGELTTDNKPALNLSPIQWVSGLFNPMGMPLLGQTMVQTSAPSTIEHIIDIINTYKPRQAMMRPTDISYILQSDKTCDLSCFDFLIVGGAKVPANLLKKIKSQLRPDAVALEMCGQTETLGPVLGPNPSGPLASCGRPTPLYQIQLADLDTGAIITEPHVHGEMLVKGNIFTEYYKNPEETKKAFTADGWFKTGDLYYRDERDNYFYVERISTLIRYRNEYVIPREIEDVILSHPLVKDCCVTGAAHAASGARPAACVVPRVGARLAPHDIHDLLARNLPDKNKLRGGVFFLEALPQTPSGKTCLAKVKEIVQNAAKE